MMNRYRSLLLDRRGVTIVEFAIVAPVMLLLIMGMCDLTYRGYLQAVLSGTMQKAGRDSTIEGNDTEDAGKAIDAKVMVPIRAIAGKATYVSTRKSYSTFGAIAPEPFKDANKDGIYQPATECFTDMNGNKKRDTDPGIIGQGGASDVVVYTMTVTYPRLFPLAKMLGFPAMQIISATTILKNQPYKDQSAYTPTQVCP